MNKIKWGDLASTVGEEIVPHSTNKFLSEVFLNLKFVPICLWDKQELKKTLLEKI